MITGSEFQRAILDAGPAAKEPAAVKKLIFCTGKVYYDLVKVRREAGLESAIAISTLEQIAPFPFDLVKEECEKYIDAEVIFCQEEHKNQGAWSYVQPRFQTAIGGYDRMVHYVGRETAPSPATGSKAMHNREYNKMMAQAMAT
jgi:2-oxoglutarate dehydrogenase E1 component